MENTQNYIVDSLEQHLFFARIMKEHALFLKAGFLPPGAGLAQEGERFLRQFEGVLSRAIALSDHVVRECVLHSGEVFTQFTDCAERQTQRLTGTRIDRGLTARAMRLTGRGCDDELCVCRGLTAQVRQLNRNALVLVDRLINYKERILRCVNSCGLFTANYPLLIEHILREARLYRAHLRRLEGLEDRSCQGLRGAEVFWNQSTMAHPLVLRGLLRKMNPFSAIAVSAVFFAILHMNPWQAIPAFCLGLLFGYTYYKTGSLKLTMLMHCANNTMAVIFSKIPQFKEAETFMDVLSPWAYWSVYAACIVTVICALIVFGRREEKNGR